MNDILSQPGVQTNAAEETVLQQISAEMDYLNEQMARDRKEIERLQAETYRLKVETRAILATLGVGV